MITAELTRKINLLPQESYDRVENFVEQLLSINTQAKKEIAFNTFMENMELYQTEQMLLTLTILCFLVTQQANLLHGLLLTSTTATK